MINIINFPSILIIEFKRKIIIFLLKSEFADGKLNLLIFQLNVRKIQIIRQVFHDGFYGARQYHLLQFRHWRENFFFYLLHQIIYYYTEYFLLYPQKMNILSLVV